MKTPKTYLRDFLELFKGDTSTDAQIAILNIMKVIEYSKRNLSTTNCGLSNEKFVGIDLRYCSGMGYSLTNTSFDSCYINSSFFTQTVHFMGAVYLKFIPFGEDSCKYLASISEYGNFTIIDFNTRAIVYSKDFKGYHNDDVIFTSEHGDFILVAVYGKDNFHDTKTDSIFVFDKKTFDFVREIDGGSVSQDIWERFCYCYPLMRQPRYYGYSPSAWHYDGAAIDPATIEYTISSESRMDGDVFVGLTVKTFQANQQLQELYETAYESEIVTDNLFCFYSDGNENKLFVGYAQKHLAVELEVDEDVNVRFLKDVIFTEDKLTMVAYQTNQPWIFVWSLPSGNLRKIRAAKYGVYAAACTSDSKSVVMAGNDNELRVFDLQYGSQINSVTDNYKIEAGCMLSDAILASCLDNGIIKMWDIASGKLVTSFPAHSKAISGMFELSDGRFITYSEDSTLKLWTFDKQNCILKEIWTFSELSSEVRFSVTTADRLIASSWSEIIEWDINSFKKVKEFPISKIGSMFHQLGISPDGRLFAYTRFNSSNDKENAVVFYDIGKMQIAFEIHPEITPDCLAFTPDGKTIAFEFSDKVELYGIANDNPHKIGRLYTDGQISVFPKVSHDDAPGDRAFFLNIDTLSYIKGGQVLVVATREGVSYYYETDNYTLIDIKCMRGSFTFIDYIDNDVIVASDWNSLYIWNQNAHTVDFIPNINAGFPNCDIKNLKTDDISVGFLCLLERNGITVYESDKDLPNDEPQKIKAAESSLEFKPWKYGQHKINYLLGATYCDYGDALNVFTQSEKLNFQQCEIALNYLRCLYEMPLASESIIPLIYIEGIARFHIHKPFSTSKNFGEILSKAYDVFQSYPHNGSEISTLDTSEMMAKCTLWAVEMTDVDFAYEVVFERYIKNMVALMSPKDATVSTLDSALFALVNKIVESMGDDNREAIVRISNIARFMSENFIANSYETSTPYVYMNILFELIRIQPQDERLDTLDKMFGVYYKNRYLSSVFPYMMARAYDHFGGEYLMNFYGSSIHYIEMIIRDIRVIMRDHPTDLDVLFVLATYLAVFNGQKDISKIKPNFTSMVKVFFRGSSLKKPNLEKEKSLDEIFASNPQLWEIQSLIPKIFESYTNLPEEKKDEEKFKAKIERIHGLLNMYYAVSWR